MQKSAWLKWFVPQLYQLLRGVLEWQALKYFYMIHRVGRPQPFWLIRFCEATQTSECSDTSEVELHLMFSKTADVSLSYRPSWVVPKVFSGSGVNTKMQSSGEWSRSGGARSASISGHVSEDDSPVCDSLKRIECGRYSHGCWACDTPWHLRTHTHTRTGARKPRLDALPGWRRRLSGHSNWRACEQVIYRQESTNPAYDAI